MKMGNEEKCPVDEGEKGKKKNRLVD